MKKQLSADICQVGSLRKKKQKIEREDWSCAAEAVYFIRGKHGNCISTPRKESYSCKGKHLCLYEEFTNSVKQYEIQL